MISERGPLLEALDGHVWRLQTTEDLAVHEAQPVQIEAWQRGPSLLELLWIGPSAA